MGFENREYARGGSSTGSMFGWGAQAPACRFLLIATVVVFFAQFFTTRELSEDERQVRVDELVEEFDLYSPFADPELTEEQIESWAAQQTNVMPRKSRVEEWLQMDTQKVLKGQIWRLVTYAFCHDRISLWHILWNMLFLWWFGPAMEAQYGSREFTLFYFVAAAIGSLAYLFLDLITGNPLPMIGASGAVSAVLMLFACYYPRHTILVMFLIPIEVRWIVLIHILFDLHPVLLSLSGETLYDSVAHACHLGGFAFGYAYYRQQWRLGPGLAWVERFWKHQRLRSRNPHVRMFRPADDEADDAEVDRVLQKISEEGADSLTAEERRILEQASERLRGRSGR